MDLLTELTRANHDPAVIAQVRALMEQSARAQQVLAEKDFKITALTLELAYYRRIKFGKKSEAFSGDQRELFEETVGIDLAAIEAELVPPDSGNDDAGKRKRSRAGRQPLPAELPRVEHRHEPESCQCAACGKGLVKIGEDISEQLDVEPARFFVHRHIRPQYACRACEIVTAAPVPPARARWNIIAQQTLMAQSTQVKLARPDDGRFWTDGWDGYPMARQRLFEALAKSRASNPLVISGDVHTFYATELRSDFYRPASKANPILATEFCGTSVTSSSRPQKRTLEYLELNPHIKYGRSDKRGFMLMEVTPAQTTTHFVGLDDVRDPATKAQRLASFVVNAGQTGLERN